MKKNFKNLKKNKKGFTLVEIIVVLVIMGILLAIAVPSIMGYVGKANNAKIEAEARSGYVAAQTLVAKAAANSNAKGTTLAANVTAAAITKELSEAAGDATIESAGCSIVDDGTKIEACAMRTTSNDSKVVVFIANPATGVDPISIQEYASDSVTVSNGGTTESPVSYTITLAE